MWQERKEKLIREIEQAFADIEYPGDDKIVPVLNQMDYWRLSNDFKGTDWKAIDPDILVKHVYDLPLLTSEAFRFYLPAYLIAALSGHPSGDFSEFTYYGLVPPEAEGSEMDWFLERVNGFNTLQKSVIKEYVQLYIERDHFDSSSLNERTAKFWKDA
jgi:uncharacterized protein DUF6714